MIKTRIFSKKKFHIKFCTISRITQKTFTIVNSESLNGTRLNSLYLSKFLCTINLLPCLMGKFTCLEDAIPSSIIKSSIYLTGNSVT